MALSLALDLVGGPAFDGLSASVSRAMDRDAAFTDLLQHMDHTLKSLKNQAGVISEIQQYNMELGLSTIEIMRLSTEMDVGRMLVDRLSRIKFRLWNFFCCCTSICAERLRKLNRELESLFTTLQLELIRDTKEILILQRQNRDDFDKMKVMLQKILQKIDDPEVKGLLKNLVKQNSGGSMETSTSTSASGSNTEDEGNGATQAASFEGLVQEAFRLLINTVEEVKERGMMFKPLLLRLKSTLDCLRPFIEEMAQHNKVLDHPEEKLEKLRIQMENGVNLIRKCSSVCRWTSNKKDKYTKQVLELDEFLQGQLSILTVKVARDVKGTSELIRNIKEVVKRIEGSDMVQNQDEFQGSCDITEPPIPPVEFQGSWDITEPPVPPVKFQGSCDLTEPPVPQPQQERMPNFSVDETVTVGLDVPLKELKRELLNDEESSALVLTGPAGRGKTTLAKTLCQDDEVKVSSLSTVERTRDVEETMISVRNTEAGVKPIDESGVVQNQLETKGIFRICSRKIVSDTSSSAGTSLFLMEKTPTFQSKDYQSTDGHISETSNLRVFSYEESGVLLNQIQTKGWSAVADRSLPTDGLDVVNEQGTTNVEETTILLRDTEDSLGSVQIEPAEPEQEYGFMGTDVSKVVETVRKPHSFKVHRSMCIELLKLVDRISKIFPDIEAARPRCSTGIKALCDLNMAIEKAKQLLQYCSESSKLYLALTGNVMVLRCQKSRNLLEQSLCQIQSWVPVIMAVEIFQIIDDLKGATFKLDPSDEEAGKVVRGLIHQDVSALNSIEASELKALQLASLRLHITSKKEILIEKRSIKKLIQKVGDGDPRKTQILTHFFYLLKKYGNLILVKQTESASMRQQGSLSSENSGNGFECKQYAEVEQSSMLLTAARPEEFSCGISSRLMYDPVVIASGQTYERMWIQKWFDEGHDTCPKTNVKLTHLSLTPNIAMKKSIAMWCKKYGVTIPNPSMQPEALDAWENSSTSIFSSSIKGPSLQTDLSTKSFGSLDTSFISDSSRTKTEDGLSLVQIDDGSLKYQYAINCETDLESLSNISELKWDSQCKVVQDVKNYLECNAQASYSMSSKNFVEPLIKFLRDAHDLDDVKAQRDGFKLLSTLVRKNRNGISCLCEETYSLLASSLDSKVTEEVLAIMEILSGHQDCRCKISSSGALASILKLLYSQIRNIQGKVIKVLYNLSFDRELCSEMVSLDCIPKLVPLFEDSALTGICISILKNLCDTEGARISIAETNGCIASVVEVLDIGTKEEREHAVDILLSLCSQRIDYCRLVMHEGVIPALVYSSANGTERARINSTEILRLLRDIDYVHDHESPRSSAATSLFSEATASTFSDDDDQSTDGHIMETSSPRLFGFAELKTAARNFSPEGIIGEGSFGDIFRGWVDEKTLAPSKAGTGMIVAIKKLDREGGLGVREWQLEVYYLGRLSHPNLVKLLGYCCEGNELLLVYEYMQNRSLENHLFIRIPNKEPLSWDKRIKIALGAARGLAFLHSSVDQAIFRDFKASNILLDRNYNAKISTFGLANLGPTGGDSHVSSRVMDSYGYAAPEYIATGHLYLESDVYGFGVVLLEILTGLRAFDTKRPSGQHNLVDWTKPLLSSKRKLKTIMDAGMEGQYSFKAALKTAHITLKCLAPDPNSRPSMKEVVDELEQIQAIKEKLTSTSS